MNYIYVNNLIIYINKVMERNIDKPYKDFEKSIDFIIPTDVTPENAIKSFVNLKNRDPDESKKKNKI